MHDAVGEHLIARPQLQQVVGDHVPDLDLGDRAVPHDAGARSVEHGQPVESPFRPNLLEDADGRVRDDDEAEQAVLPAPGQQDAHEERGQ